MPSKEHEKIVATLSGGLGLETMSIEEQRSRMETLADMFPIDSDVITEETSLDGIEADWVRVPESESKRVVLYLHGGGYTKGSRKTHRNLASRIARAAKASVLLPEYRLAPESPFPAAIDDSVQSWRWLISSGFRPERIAIAGDSAGGGLALGTLLALKSTGEDMPACAVLLSPVTDLEVTGATAELGAVDDPMMTPEGLRDSGMLYAASNLHHPFAAPLYGDPKDLPATLIQVGSREILMSDSTRFADKARAAGVNVTLEIGEGLIHVWQIFADLPEAQDAVDSIGAFVQRHT